MKTQHRSRGFTLVEVLVAAGIVVVLMVVLLGMTDQTQRLVKATSSKVEQFQEARVAFESMTRRLSQATLNTFWDYVYDQNGNPNGYARKSELRFHSGPMQKITGNKAAPWPGHGVFFQAPLGVVSDTTNLGSLDHLMNSWGYFVEIGDDSSQYPQFLLQNQLVLPRHRYRLMEFMEPSERLSVYKFQNDINNWLWFSQSIAIPGTATASRPVRVMAENIVALIILPRLSVADEKRINPLIPPLLTGKSGTKDYVYDSTTTGNYNPKLPESVTTNNPLLNTKNQLPPVVQVIMVAIDEPSAKRLEDLYPPAQDQYMGIKTSPDPLSNRTLFADPSVLNDTANGAPGDLTRLQNLLSSSSKPSIRASYRVFSTNVTIKGAKWSLHTSN